MLGLANRKKIQGYEHPEMGLWANIVAGIEVCPGRCSRRLLTPRSGSVTREEAVWPWREHLREHCCC